ncbi:phospholipase D-like domain-containing protein [Solwaraspora sp. WMMD1047]|uniref:phospholipase D-like domain-containing protein n=1 Tax=Solwaraspora sp. WMMD1047 TaxID=3016102 RepID=UPI0024160F9A|nr:phospholipase D-like domain-containing protein [Solwaraspora sp. WMMD1047]MDG4833589.1 phospholipase D-like domain-containing protein [Solwaraspora sp. WMMD1047]
MKWQRIVANTTAFVVAAGAALTAVATPAQAAAGVCNEQGNYEVCSIFGGAAEDTLIARKMIAKINATANAAQSGDYIRVAMFAWRKSGHGEEVADALVRAKQKGVSVRIVMGTEHVDSGIVAKFEDKDVDIDLVQCRDSCMPPERGAMHNKFIAIKKGDTRLVLQTSSNLDANQAMHAQNMLIVRDDTELFSAYVNYWRRLYARSWTWEGVSWNDDDAKNHYGSNGNSRAYFFPQPTKQPLPGVLRNVTECTSGNNRVWVQASHIDESSFSQNVFIELGRLRALGCDVRIIVQKTSQMYIVSRYALPARCDGYNHNKLVLIDAKYAGEWRKAVFVGSYNLSENSNDRANDAMLRIINGWVTNRYIDQFNQQWNSPGQCDAD